MRISAIAQKLRFRCHVNGHGPTKLRPGGMSIDVALSTRRGVGRDTYSLPQKRGYAASGTSMGEAA